MRLLLAASLLAAPTAALAQTKSDPAADKEDKVVCRNVQEVHSRIPERICRRASEWKALARGTEDELRRTRNDRRNSGSN